MRAIRGVLLAGLGVLLALGETGCGRRYYQVVETPTRRTSSYQAVQIVPLDSAEFIETLPPEHKPKYTSTLAEGSGLIRGDAAHYLQERFALTEEGGPGVLVVRPVLKQFNPGSRAGRYFSGGWGGKGILTIRWTLEDGETGERIGAARYEEVIRGGWYGGSAMGLFRHCGVGVAQSVLDYYE